MREPKYRCKQDPRICEQRDGGRTRIFATWWCSSPVELSLVLSLVLVLVIVIAIAIAIVLVILIVLALVIVVGVDFGIVPVAVVLGLLVPFVVVEVWR